jgi:hypothetical protein
MVKTSKTVNELKNTLYKTILYFHNNIRYLNSSKIFAGLIVITLNIASRFVTIRLSKAMESYLKFTLSRDVLVFCIVWMGSREIYVAFTFTILFTFIMDFLLNEESSFCILPETFTTYHTALLDEMPSQDDIINAQKIIDKSKGISLNIDANNK